MMRPDPDAFAAARPATLDLPSPLTLPAALAPTPAEAARVAAALAALLAALDDPDPQARATRSLAAADALDDGAEAPSLAVGPTGAPVDPAEIEDFDRYFDVRRVEDPAPALALSRALTRTAAAVLALAARAGDRLPAGALAAQIAGFAAHARLLARVCGIEAPR